MVVHHYTPLADEFAVMSDIATEFSDSGRKMPQDQIWYFDVISDDGTECLQLVFRRGVRDVVELLHFREGKRTRLAWEAAARIQKEERSTRFNFGSSYFEFATAEYGSGFSVHLEDEGRRPVLSAQLEWLSIEYDVLKSFDSRDHSDYWNFSVPRADVTGRITTFDKRGRETGVNHIRGTGYHEYRTARKASNIAGVQWMRAHGADLSLIFCSQMENSGILVIIRDEDVKVLRASSAISKKWKMFDMARRPPFRWSAEDGTLMTIVPTDRLNRAGRECTSLCDVLLEFPDRSEMRSAGIVRSGLRQDLGSRLIHDIFSVPASFLLRK